MRDTEKKVQDLLIREISILSGSLEGAAINAVWEDDPELANLVARRVEKAVQEERKRAYFRI